MAAAEEEEEYPNKETEDLFDGVEKGDEEVVKVLLLGNKNKQFEFDINFQFKEKKVFFFQTQFSISLSLSFLMKKLSKFFFLETFLISTPSSKTIRFFFLFQTQFLSLSCCSGMMEYELCDDYFLFVLLLYYLLFCFINKFLFV